METNGFVDGFWVRNPFEIKSLKPVKMRVSRKIAKYMKLVHSEAVTITSDGVIVSAFF